MRTVIADLGIGNLHSLRKALEAAGAHPEVSAKTEEWLDADALVLPGVGAFGAGMKALQPVHDAVRAKLTSGAPALGVCLGLQLMLERSDESPNAEGLSFLRGDVKRFPIRSDLRVPHMGWAQVHHEKGPFFEGIAQDAYFYFVHSFYPDPEDDCRIAATDHGVRFTSALRKANTVAAQFHPEKSGPDGLRFLKNWVAHAEEKL